MSHFPLEFASARRRVSTDTALRLARFFGTSMEFWMNLQANHDLSKARQELQATINRDVVPISDQA
jgi:plasmid maintenance system antidote protein VapI